MRAAFGDLFDEPPSVAALRQTILNLAVRGRLVAQDAGDEPAGELLRRIEREKDERARRVSTSRDRPNADEDDLQPWRVPVSWEWVPFGTIAEHRLGKMLDQHKNKGDFRPYLRNLNVQWDTFKLDDVQEMRFEDGEVDEYRLIDGDLLICEGGEPGRCAIWHSSEEMMFQKALHRARPMCGISSRYLLFHLWADAQSGRLGQAFTGATIMHLTGKSLAAHYVALPPIAEQRRIVAKVDELMRLCDALEAKLAGGEAARSQLAGAVLAGVVA